MSGRVVVWWHSSHMHGPSVWVCASDREALLFVAGWCSEGGKTGGITHQGDDLLIQVD